MKKKIKIIFAVLFITSLLIIEGCYPAYVGVGVYGPGAWGGYGGYTGRIGTPYGW